MKNPYVINKICCIGAGYVGGPTMAVMADKCPNICITVVDNDPKKIDLWNSKDLDLLPVYEPGLKEIIMKVRSRNLFFSSDCDQYIKSADAVFISVNTPIKSSGLGAGQASNLCWVESCARKIADIAEGHTLVIEKSTLPVKTAQMIKEILHSKNNLKLNNNSKTFDIISNPEFLAEGTAIKDLEKPDRVLIGGENKKATEAVANIYNKWVDQKKIIFTNLWSSELSKLAANAFLAQRISSINSISALCETTGANIDEVSKAVGSDSRIGNKFLNAGPGFGGSCFRKDILNLIYLSKYFGLIEVANYWEQVVIINSWQQERIYRLIVEKLFGNLHQKNITILGFAFKGNTNDTRDSPAINITKKLLNEGANIKIHDPKVSELQIKKLLNSSEKSNESKWEFFSDIYQSIFDSDAVVVLTEWEQYKCINWSKVSRIMRSPAWVFDARSITNKQEIEKVDLNYWCVGMGLDKD